MTKKNNMLKVCTDWFQGDKKAIATNCRKLIKTYDDDVTRYRPMLVAAQKCKRDAACWAGKLTDKNGRVREKAAWELGMIRDPKTLGALLAAVKDDDLEAKWAEMQAIEQLLFGDDTRTPAPATAKAGRRPPRRPAQGRERAEPLREGRRGRQAPGPARPPGRRGRRRVGQDRSEVAAGSRERGRAG